MRMLALLLLLLGNGAMAQRPSLPSLYDKRFVMVPMRDGVRLATVIYTPKSKAARHPILMERTPYGAGPYEGAGFTSFGGSRKFVDAGYIFVFQDVRGRNRSEGVWAELRPQLLFRSGPDDADESTDAYDTIDWLIKNVPNNNGRVGMWGISYPGGYAALGAINSHPALKAVSPQAPTADWFLGDDDHHNGALFLLDVVSFYAGFGAPRPRPGDPPTGFVRPNFGGDAYKFFLELGPIRNLNERYFKEQVQHWNDILRHGTYSEFWQSRSVPRNMRNVRCAVLTVGGWYDAEDLWGALNVYRATEAQNAGIFNALVMGPWSHGGWSDAGTRSFGPWDLGGDVSTAYIEEIEFPFFDAFLRGDGKPKLAEARAFDTGTNRWQEFPRWPPPARRSRTLFFGPGKSLAWDAPPKATATNQYESDPANPVPYTATRAGRRVSTYMAEDQRFASARPDVLTYETPVLEQDVQVAGPVDVDLRFRTSGTDLDFVVKLIDVLPEGSTDRQGRDVSGAQRLVRAEVFRARFRRSYVNPAALRAGQEERVRYGLPDVFHTFRKGHRLMVQVQSSWFPLVDRNPQSFVDIGSARETDFQKATVDVLVGGANGTRVTIGELPIPR